MKKNLVLIFGGVSPEHDISIITAMQVFSVLKDDYNILLIYINKDGQWYNLPNDTNISFFPIRCYKKLKIVSILPNAKYLYLKKLNRFVKYKIIDVAINCMHGINGEDGSIASIFQLNNIPYVNSSILGSSIACDKVVFKLVVNGLNIKSVDSFAIYKSSFFKNKAKNIKHILGSINFPLIIKPSKLGSSIGIKICHNENELIENIRFCFQFDEKLLIEKYLSEIREINIAILKNENELVLSELEEPIKTNEILSFEEKYLSQDKLGMQALTRKLPADIDLKIKNKIESYAKKIYKALDLNGVGRFDFIIDKNNEVYINELNVIPGSYAYYLFEAKNIDFKQSLEMQISQSLLNQYESNLIIKTFNSSVLNNVGFKTYNKTKYK